MPLQTQNITVPFQAGLDTRSDSKVGNPVRLSVLQNGVWTKKDTVTLRPGYDVLSRTIATGGSIASGNSAHEHRGELLQFSSKTLYSRASQNSNWISRGLLPSAPVEVKSIIQNEFGQSFQDVARVSNIEVYAWVDTRSATVRASVYDTTSNTFIQSDVEIFQQATGISYIPSVRVVSISTFIFVVYRDGANIKAKRLSSSTPHSFDAAVTLVTDLNVTYGGFDIVTYDSGAAAFCYGKTSDAEIGVGYLKSDGTIGNGGNGYAAPVTITDTFQTNIMQVIISSAGKVWVVWVTRRSSDTAAATEAIKFFSRNVDLTADNAVTTIITHTPGAIGTTPGRFGRLGGLFESASSLRVFYEEQIQDLNPQVIARLSSTAIQTVAITTGGSVGSISTFIYWHRLLSIPFLSGTDIYLNLLYNGGQQRASGIYNSTTSSQKTAYTIRYSDKAVLARLYSGQADISKTLNYADFELGELIVNVHNLPRVINYSTSKYAFPLQVNSLVFNPATSIADGNIPPDDGQGIIKVEVDITTEPRIISERAGEDIYFSPGPLHLHDGAQLVEAGFYQYPDLLWYKLGTWSSAVTQQGTGALPEIKTITCQPGNRVRPSDIIGIFNAGGTPRLFAFIVDGEGNPNLGPAGTISISSYDTANEVATAVKNTIDAHADFIATVLNNVVTVTNAANGNVSDSVTLPLDSSAGTLPAGTYNYRAVYLWADINGEIHRSAPSPILTVTTTTTDIITVNIPTLQLTKKKDPLSPVVIELYRTTASGTIFYRLPRMIYIDDTSVGNRIYEEQQLINDETLPFRCFIDTTSDATLVSQTILYTQGGVAENIFPPSAEQMAFGDNRAMLTGFKERPNEIWISKRKFTNEGVAFNDTFILEINPYGGNNTALRFFNDKWIVFQEKSILWFLGEGPDDLGFGQNFTDPQYISKDIGCPYPTSIKFIPAGLVFKSQKGWWLIDNRLSLIYIGEDAQDFNNLTPTSCVVLDSKHQVRWTHSDGEMLVYDYVVNAWSVFTSAIVDNAVGAVMWGGVYTLLQSDGKVYTENASKDLDDTTDIVFAWETMFIALGGIAGMQRVYQFLPLGNFTSGNVYTFKTKLDYNETVIDTIDFSTGATEKILRAQPSVQKCFAMKVQFEALQAGLGDECSGLTFVLGVKKGGSKLPASKTSGGPTD